MRDFQIGTDLIGSLRTGAYVAAAADDYVVLFSGNRFAVFVDGAPLGEFTHPVDGFEQAELVARVWLEAFRRGADHMCEFVDA